MRALLSVVSPVYRAENLLDELVARLIATLSALSDRFEIVLVEDGGGDGSWARIEEICRKDPRVRGIQLSRNFGQHAAIAAGIESAKGDWVVVMDCDLQDRPEEIPALYRKALEGYDVILARRAMRSDGPIKQFQSWIFYALLSFLSGAKYDSSIANFGIYHRRVVDTLMQVHGSLHFFPLMVKWVGFKKEYVRVEHARRPEGESSYNFGKRLKLAFNILLTYSNKPLQLIVVFGLCVSLMAFFLALFIVYQALHHKIQVLGYSSLIVSISFFSGVIISILGILGLYIGKIFDSIKVKPTYLIKSKINDNSFQ